MASGARLARNLRGVVVSEMRILHNLQKSVAWGALGGTATHVLEERRFSLGDLITRVRA